MEFTNKGFINFNEQYNKQTDTFMTASMSFANGKDENGNYKNGYIPVVAYNEVANQMQNALGQLVEVKGRYREREYTDQQGRKRKQPQFVINEFVGLGGNAPSKPATQQQNFNREPMGNPMDISDLDLPF